MPDRMTIVEAVDVLKLASAYDGRHPSELQATVWAADLAEHGITASEATAALRRFYTDRPDAYAKPGHVIALIHEQRREQASQQLSASARQAIGGADRPGVLRKNDDAGLRRIHEIINQAKARAAQAASGPVAGQRATGITYDEIVAAGERIVTRTDKIIHPSGDDDGDGSAWAPQEDA